MPVAEAYIVGRVPAQNRGTVLGIYYFGRVGIGIVTPIVGNLADHFSFSPIFTVIGLIVLVTTIVCSIPLWEKRNEPVLN